MSPAERRTMPKPGKMTKHHLNWLIYFDEWEIIGKYFGFNPEFLPLQMTIKAFDWKSAPPEMIQLMRGPGPVRLKANTKPASVPRKVKKWVSCLSHWDRQGGLCFYCGVAVERARMTKDHKVPRSRGGTSMPNNIVGACSPCNHAKGSMLFEEFLATDYLPEERRVALGFNGKPTSFHRKKRGVKDIAEPSGVKYRPLG